MNQNYNLSFLQCYICYQALKKPKMCPSCSKVTCQKCLREWVQDHRSECPHCRKIMPLQNFAECERFISDVKHLVLAMDKKESLQQKCTQHNMQMQYYCSDCEVALCADCGMFGKKHRNHSITRLNKIYQIHKAKILNQLTKFDRNLEGYRKNGYEIKLQMQRLHMNMEQKKSFIEEYFIAVLQRLKDEFKEKEEVISKKNETNMKEIQFLESVRENLCHDLEGHSQNQLIRKCEQFISYIEMLCDKEPENENQSQGSETINEMIPKFHSFQFVLENYYHLDEGVKYSKPKLVNGIEWRLKIYPKGNGAARQTHLSVFLEMSKGYINEKKYEYKIELVNQKLIKDSISREYASNFDIGQCWGYNQFISLQELQNDFVSEEGSLLFKFSVRNTSYRSLVMDKNNYIEHLEHKLKDVKEEDKFVEKVNLKKMKSHKDKMNELYMQAKKKKQQIHKLLAESESQVMEEPKVQEIQHIGKESKLCCSLIQILNEVEDDVDKQQAQKILKNLHQ